MLHGTLELLESMLQPASSSATHLMSTDQVLSEMGFQSPSSQVVKDVKVAVGGEGGSHG